jgi:uncharacterized membrane protein
MLKFVNAYKEDIWVAYMFLAQDVCGGEGGDWQAIGWYHIAPGGSSVAYANDLDDVNNRYWCYYAENQDRSVFWAGPYPVYVPADGSPFNTCYKKGVSNSRIIGMRLFDVDDYDNFTMTLHE